MHGIPGVTGNVPKGWMIYRDFNAKMGNPVYSSKRSPIPVGRRNYANKEKKSTGRVSSLTFGANNRIDGYVMEDAKQMR
jgi:hypothetical protein